MHSHAIASLLIEAAYRVAGDVPGHEFHGNQWTEGRGDAHMVPQDAIPAFNAEGQYPIYHFTQEAGFESLYRGGVGRIGAYDPIADVQNLDPSGSSSWTRDPHYAVRDAEVRLKVADKSTLGLETRPVVAALATDISGDFLAPGTFEHEEVVKGVVPAKSIVEIAVTHKVYEDWSRTPALYRKYAREGRQKAGATTNQARHDALLKGSAAYEQRAAFYDELLADPRLKVGLTIRSGFDHAKNRYTNTRDLGDHSGHEFHGNQWTDKGIEPGDIGEGGVKLPTLDSELTPETIDALFTKAKLPDEARTPDGAERVFQQRLRALNPTYFHESPGDVSASITRKGLTGGEFGDANFAAINVPSNYITSPTKTLVEFKTGPQHVVPDVSYGWSAKLSDHQVLLLQFPKLTGAYVGVLENIQPRNIVKVSVVGEKRTLGDFEGHPFHGNQWTGGDATGVAEDQRQSIAAHQEHYGQLFNEFGVTSTDAYIREVNQRLQLAMPDAKVYVRMNVGDLNNVLSSGEVQNAFQSNRSHGGTTADNQIDFGRRRYVEEKLFGIPSQAPGEARPKYGYLSSGNGITEMHGNLKGAGGVAVQLRDTVHERTTFTTGDSADHAVSLMPEGLGGGWMDNARFIPQPMSKPSILAVPSGTVIKGKTYNGDTRVKATKIEHFSDDYVEAQVHGKITLHDIKSVTFATKPSAAMAKRLDRLGIAHKSLNLKHLEARDLGDVEGHPFHGNQWTDGVGSSDPANKDTWYAQGGEWNRSPIDGSEPYGWALGRPSANYTVPALTHTVVRDRGVWGSSHGASRAITGASAEQMGIAGYNAEYVNADGQKIAATFLTHIGDDKQGAEEPLYHSFENTQGTDFKVGDTLRLPLTASSGDVGSYGVRLDKENQRGEPTVFVFPKGTQMSAYSKWSAADAKEFGHVWSEAIVAGGYAVTKVHREYLGSQHDRGSKETQQLFGKVVHLTQTESYHPERGWSPR